MERIIHRFSSPDGQEVRLILVADRGASHIEWRRFRRDWDGTMVPEGDRFPIRLAWIPSLIEGLQRVEEDLRETGLDLAAGPARGLPPTPAAPPRMDPSQRLGGRFPRFAIRAPLIVSVQSKDLKGPRVLTGDAVDISWGGLQALLPSRLQQGTVLEILLGLSGKAPLKLPARVAWGRAPQTQGQPRPHGLAFLPADPRLRQIVEQHILGLARAPRSIS